MNDYFSLKDLRPFFFSSHIRKKSIFEDVCLGWKSLHLQTNLYCFCIHPYKTSGTGNWENLQGDLAERKQRDWWGLGGRGEGKERREKMSLAVFVFTWSGSDSTCAAFAFEGKKINCKWFFLLLLLFLMDGVCISWIL